MLSVIQKKLYNSVKVFWINKELLNTRISQAVKRLTSQFPHIEKVILFGSVADNRHTPFSDVDILIVVKNSNLRFIDRPLVFKKYFEDIGLGVDIIVYTHKEIEEDIIPLARVAMKKGKVLFEKK